MSSETRSRSPIDPEIVRELADILRETDLSEIEVERGDLRLRIARQLQAAQVVQAVAAPAAAAAPPGYAVETPGPVAGAGDLSAHPGVVNSPMVGTAYLKPNPESDNFVKVGEMVKKGDTILLIEAMKTFNPIIAEKSGKISEILVEEGQPVEFGEPLFILI